MTHGMRRVPENQPCTRSLQLREQRQHPVEALVGGDGLPRGGIGHHPAVIGRVDLDLRRPAGGIGRLAQGLLVPRRAGVVVARDGDEEAGLRAADQPVRAGRIVADEAAARTRAGTAAAARMVKGPPMQ